MQQNPRNKHKSQPRVFKMWSALTILMLLIAIVVVVSWILKWSNVQTQTNDPTQTSTPVQALGIFDIFLAPINGFGLQSEIIIFILILGVFLNIVISSRALESFSQRITYKMQGKEIWSIIPLMVFFSACGTIQGSAEETLGYYMIFIPLMIAAGFDKITGFLIVFLGAGAGVMGSTLNPFSIGAASDALKESGIENFSITNGLVWRFIGWIILTTLAICFVMHYARRIKKDPQKSIVFATYEADKKFFLSESVALIPWTGKRKATMIIFLLTYGFMVLYLINWDDIFQIDLMTNFNNWVHQYVPYLSSTSSPFGTGALDVVAGIFLVSTIILACINQLGEEEYIHKFMEGSADLVSVALIIATAGGISWALEASNIKDLIVNGLTNSISSVNSSTFILIILFIAFIPIGFLIPSSSGFAKAIFPLMAGVVKTDVDVLGSGTVTAFSYAIGIVNLVTPTSAVVMGALSIAKIPYNTFIKIIWPILAIFIVVAIGLIAIGSYIPGTLA